MTLKPVTAPAPPTPIEELLDILARLRHPVTGSPWEREQTSFSIAPNMLEEAYEAVDAITRGDMNELKGELGDVLLQVVFHAQIAKEQGHFGFNEVVETINTKIKSRLPAFFSGVETDVKTQLSKWEEIKNQERAAKGYTSVFDGIAPNLPALVRANKLQDRAVRMGFKWDDITPILAKVQEETKEVEAAIKSGDKAHIEEELGDLISIVSTLCYELGIDAETAQRKANNKFEGRMRHIESSLKERGIDPKTAGMAEMWRLWKEAKTKAKVA